MDPPPPDPIRQRRARVAGWVKAGKRLGWLLFLAATVLVVVGLATELSGPVAVAATACLIAGTVLLAPAIVLGYAVSAAEREDRSRGL